MANKRKIRKFAAGGDFDVSDSPDMSQNIKDFAAERQSGVDSGSFGAAFKEARASGDKTFTWRGKKYTTDVAKPAAKKPSYEEDYAKAKASSDKLKAQKVADKASATTRANAYSSKLADESAARSNPYGYASMYKKGGKVKKYAEGGNVNYSENEVSRMKPATPDNTKRLQERARKMGASEASIQKATKGYSRGGGIESRGKTKVRFV